MEQDDKVCRIKKIGIWQSAMRPLLCAFAMIADLQLEVDKVHCWKYRERHFDLIGFFYQIKGGIIDELR